MAHRDAQDNAARRAQQFRELIVEALDVHHLKQQHVAELAGVSRSRLHKILEAEYRRP